MWEEDTEILISRPARSAMQSGRAKTREWQLEYAPKTPRRPEPLMGWCASEDTLSQICLRFSTLEEAIAWAEARGLSYTVLPHQERKIPPKNYADNFRARPK